MTREQIKADYERIFASTRDKDEDCRIIKAKSGVWIKTGNAKLVNLCGIFNLPSIKTCPNCRHCASTCYAFSDEIGRFGKSVKPARERNYQASLTDKFVNDVIALIRKSGVSIFRIHESGDFYCQAYADKWTQIIKALPEVMFYTYTKSPFRPEKLSNLNIVESILPCGSVNYGTVDFVERKAAELNAWICPCNYKQYTGKICGGSCQHCATDEHVLFVAHGAKKRSPEVMALINAMINEFWPVAQAA